MEFLLIMEWMDEENGYLYETWVESYRTKEELLAAKKKTESDYDWQVKIGRLHMFPAIRYSWSEIEKEF